MFKVGDKVVVVNAPNGFSIKNGEEHEVHKIGQGGGGEGVYVYLKAFPDKWYYADRFSLVEDDIPAPVKKKRITELAAGDLVRILPCPEHFKHAWAHIGMEGMVGKVYPLIRPMGLNKKEWYIKGDVPGWLFEYFFPSDGLQHLNTYDLLYQAAKEMRIPGRGRMTKEQL